MAAVKAPTTRIMVSESVRPYGDSFLPMANPDWGTTSPDAWYREVFAGHLGTMNCLYVDGHVKSMRPTATMTPVNQWGKFDAQNNANSAGCDNSVSRTEWINCEDVDPTSLTNLAILAKKYQ